jgi:hypothetical protein
MEQDGLSSFNVTVNGETVSIPLEKARALCPNEVAAMEKAGEDLSRATAENNNLEAARATNELQKRMMDLYNTLVEATKRQQS